MVHTDVSLVPSWGHQKGGTTFRSNKRTSCTGPRVSKGSTLTILQPCPTPHSAESMWLKWCHHQKPTLLLLVHSLQVSGTPELPVQMGCPTSGASMDFFLKWIWDCPPKSGSGLQCEHPEAWGVAMGWLFVELWMKLDVEMLMVEGGTGVWREGDWVTGRRLRTALLVPAHSSRDIQGVSDHSKSNLAFQVAVIVYLLRQEMKTHFYLTGFVS